jgi:hypothetical protein
VQSLFDDVGCDRSSLDEALGNGKVTRTNLQDYLAIIEQVPLRGLICAGLHDCFWFILLFIYTRGCYGCCLKPCEKEKLDQPLTS